MVILFVVLFAFAFALFVVIVVISASSFTSTLSSFDPSYATLSSGIATCDQEPIPTLVNQKYGAGEECRCFPNAFVMWVRTSIRPLFNTITINFCVCPYDTRFFHSTRGLPLSSCSCEPIASPGFHSNDLIRLENENSKRQLFSFSKWRFVIPARRYGTMTYPHGEQAHAFEQTSIPGSRGPAET